jgi:hypothetical protein
VTNKDTIKALPEPHKNEVSNVYFDKRDSFGVEQPQ